MCHTDREAMSQGHSYLHPCLHVYLRQPCPLPPSPLQPWGAASGSCWVHNIHRTQEWEMVGLSSQKILERQKRVN
jgi:hypothetical protein